MHPLMKFREKTNFRISVLLITYQVVEISALQLVVWVTDTVVAEVAALMVISIGGDHLVGATDV